MKKITFMRGSCPAPAGGVVLHYVLGFIEPDLPVIVGPYNNGREQGYCVSLVSGERSVSFSENRNSDDIVVYPISGEADELGVPSEDDFSKAMYFPPGAYRDAAWATLGWLVAGKIEK